MRESMTYYKNYRLLLTKAVGTSCNREIFLSLPRIGSVPALSSVVGSSRIYVLVGRERSRGGVADGERENKGGGDRHYSELLFRDGSEVETNFYGMKRRFNV